MYLKIITRFCLFFIASTIIVACSLTREIPNGKQSIFIEKELNLGNSKQSVIIRGEDKNNPILVHLHGGPGYPLFPFIDNFKEIEKHFTMVYWEQRGTGKSFNKKINSESMNTDTLLSDLNHLINWTRNNIDTNAVFIWGHSWGSNLGMLYSAKYPNNVKAYIGTGQSVNLKENERLCLIFAMQKAKAENNKKALKQLKKIDTLNYDLKSALKVRKWIYTYGGIIHKNYQEKNYINSEIVKKVFQTPEYSLLNKWQLVLNSKYSGIELWDDMMAINLFEQVKRVNCPIYFFEGKYDAIVSSKLAAKYYHKLIATKGKKLVWFNNSAHRPHIEEPEKFITELIKVKADAK